MADSMYKKRRFWRRQAILGGCLAVLISVPAVSIVSRVQEAAIQRRIYKSQSEKLSQLKTKYPEMQSWRSQLHELLEYPTPDMSSFIVRRGRIEELLDKFEPSCKDADTAFRQIESEPQGELSAFVASVHESLKVDVALNSLLREEVDYGHQLRALSAQQRSMENEAWKLRFAEFRDREKNLIVKQAYLATLAQRAATQVGTQ